VQDALGVEHLAEGQRLDALGRADDRLAAVGRLGVLEREEQRRVCFRLRKDLGVDRQGFRFYLLAGIRSIDQVRSTHSVGEGFALAFEHDVAHDKPQPEPQ
jgi:hypothetical protein